MQKARWRTVPAFVTHALRPALARLPSWATNTCKPPLSLAAKTLPPTARATLRGGGSVFSAQKMSTTAAVANPLMVQDYFPRYAEVKSEHVVPGIKAIIAEADAALAALEADLEKKEFKVAAADLLPQVCPSHFLAKNNVRVRHYF